MLWIDFFNSLARDPLGHGTPEDRLDQPPWLQQFAEKWQLKPGNVKSPTDIAALRQLRALLHRCVPLLVEQQPLPKREIQAINRFLRGQPVRPKLRAESDGWRLELQPEAAGVDTWLFAITESFARFLVEEDPTRLKLCDNPACLWVFYDRTRSRTRRWCATSCGDLIKVREFRRRQKSG